jgi:hypothetical protein
MLTDLPYHATVKRRLNLVPFEWNWVKSNAENPVVDKFLDYFVWQCAQYDKGTFNVLKHQAQLVREEILKQVDDESFARDATL